MKKKLYQKVYDDLQSKIENGEYPLQANLPSEKELINAYGVSAITINRALSELKKDGYISRKPKEGTVVINTSKKTTIQTDVKKPLIGVILTKLDTVFGMDILNGILDSYSPDVELIIKKSDGDLDKEELLINDLVELGVEGLILLPTSSEYLAPALISLISKNFPIVVIDRVIFGLPVSSVTLNNEQTALTLTNYLLSNGHQNIAFLSSSSHISTIDEREKGFINAHAINGLPYDVDLCKHFISSDSSDSQSERKKDLESITQFIEENKKITAVFTTEYETALLVAKACKTKRKKIPEDISLVCYDHPKANYVKEPFTVTHIEQNQYEMGQESIRIIQNLIEGKSDIEKVVVTGLLIQGNSVAEPKK